MTCVFPEDVVRWLQKGERGISSDTIVAHLYNAPFVQGPSHPWDPDDLRRCVQLIEACPSVAARFKEMRDVNPIWRGLVDEWDQLVLWLKYETQAHRDWERLRPRSNRGLLYKEWLARRPTLQCYERMRTLIAAGRAEMDTKHSAVRIPMEPGQVTFLWVER